MISTSHLTNQELQYINGLIRYLCTMALVIMLIDRFFFGTSFARIIALIIVMFSTTAVFLFISNPLVTKNGVPIPNPTSGKACAFGMMFGYLIVSVLKNIF